MAPKSGLLISLMSLVCDEQETSARIGKNRLPELIFASFQLLCVWFKRKELFLQNFFIFNSI